MAMRRSGKREQGVSLLILMVLVVAGALVYLLGSFSPQVVDSYRVRKTEEALALAREALIGYALKYRDQEGDSVVYGYLPLPDLGTSRNNNIGCAEEGCDAANFTGNGDDVTVIGRLPWRTLGTEALRDGHGECLWYAVAGSHQRIHRASPMNWDTLGQLDVQVANGSGALASIVNSAHDHPVAVIFSPGAILGSQDRGRDTLSTDKVDVCGGNYNPANYLDPEPLPDPATATGLGGVRNYFPTPSSPPPPPIYAFGNTGGGNDKPLAAGGLIHKRTSDETLWPNACPAGASCQTVANDRGLALTPDSLFGELRKSGNFRTDINSLLDRMAACLRDQIAAGSGLVPTAMTGTAADKSAGRIPANACYDDAQPPRYYFGHYQDQVLVATPAGGNFDVTVDGVLQSCPGVLLLGGQRGIGQSRTAVAEKAIPANYIEGVNLASFTIPGQRDFAGPSLFGRVTPSQPIQQDIVRCIPAGASFTAVESPQLATLGFGQLVEYNLGSRTLTLGRENVTTGYGAPAGALYGCAWQPETTPLGNGLRAYFQFRFKELGGSVGNNGFVFAIVDGIGNGNNVCGASASHLAYSGDNGVTPALTFPKLGIEFDQGRNTGFSEWVTNPGRRDPCGASTCGGSVGYNSHAAIVYWGHEVANGTDGVSRPDDDDNVHGFPSASSQAGVSRPAPRNPDTSPGIEFVNLRGQLSQGGDSYLYHVRVELTPARNATGPAETRNTSITTEVWIERDSGTSADLLTAMQNTTRPMTQLYPGYGSRLRDSAALYDVPVTGSSCAADGDCLTGQACGSDNVCYRRALDTVRLGFTGSQRTQDQQVDISNFFVSWPQ